MYASTIIDPFVRMVEFSNCHKMVDRDRTVSRRSKPSSRTALTGEQPDPWEHLHPQVAMSRHRGAKRIHQSVPQDSSACYP